MASERAARGRFWQRRVRAVGVEAPENAGASTAEQRYVELRPGVLWRLSVVARLVSEDVAEGTRQVCLIVRMERPGSALSRERLGALRAESLHDVEAERLRAFVLRHRSPLGRLRRQR